jgi:hypothetical protein
MRSRTMAAVGVPLAVLLVGCGEQAPPDSTGTSVSTSPSPTEAGSGVGALVADGYAGRFRVVTGVLESPEHGPQLCPIVEESFPPQCRGADVVGWSWEGLDAESANGTTWGRYVLVGTWDGRFRLTDPASVGDGDDLTTSLDHEAPDFTSPCPEPEGGWRPVDPALTTEAAVDRTALLAEASPEFAGFWIDQPAGNNGPTRMVLNARFTDRLEANERKLRRVWGGALCVSAAPRTQAELHAVQQYLHSLPGLVMTGQDVTTSVATAQVYVATERQQRDLDERFGPGVVRLSGLLQPIDL